MNNNALCRAVFVYSWFAAKSFCWIRMGNLCIIPLLLLLMKKKIENDNGYQFPASQIKCWDGKWIINEFSTTYYGWARLPGLCNISLVTFILGDISEGRRSIGGGRSCLHLHTAAPAQSRAAARTAATPRPLSAQTSQTIPGTVLYSLTVPFTSSVNIKKTRKIINCFAHRGK